MAQTGTARSAARGPYRKTAARRREILDAALAVFGRSGYRSGSLREIAEAVGISQAGLLHHFESKSALLTAVLERRDEASLARFAGRRGADLLLTLLDVVRFNTEHRGTTELHCVLSAEATDPAHPAHRYFTDRYAHIRNLLIEAFEHVAASGQLRPGVDPASASRSTLALMDGLQVQWLLDEQSVDMVGELRDHLRRLVDERSWDAALAVHRARSSTGATAD